MRWRSEIILIVGLIFLSVPLQAQKKEIEKRIVDSIFKLKEVKQRIDYIERASKGQRHLSAVVFSRPTKSEPYYWVKVWEDNGNNYATHFHFFVYPKPFEIRYYDIVEDTAISLQEWRKRLYSRNSN